MEDSAWTGNTSEVERLMASWLGGDLFTEFKPPWIYGEIVTLCPLEARAGGIADLRGRLGGLEGAEARAGGIADLRGRSKC